MLALLTDEQVMLQDMAAGLEHLSEVYRLFRSDGSPYPVEELPVFQALRGGVADEATQASRMDCFAALAMTSIVR